MNESINQPTNNINSLEQNIIKLYLYIQNTYTKLQLYSIQIFIYKGMMNESTNRIALSITTVIQRARISFDSFYVLFRYFPSFIHSFFFEILFVWSYCLVGISKSVEYSCLCTSATVYIESMNFIEEFLYLAVLYKINKFQVSFLLPKICSEKTINIGNAMDIKPKEKLTKWFWKDTNNNNKNS